MADRALLVIVVGERYQALLRAKHDDLKRYADRCRAELIVRDAPLDEAHHRSLFSQRLLIPTSYPDYDIVASFDLDVHIANRAPDIFSEMDTRTGLAAVLDPRGTEQFRRTWRDSPQTLAETSESYFSSRDFPAVEKTRGSINGGILLFRPRVIGDLFYDYYWSSHMQNNVGDGNEEAPLAYISQTNDMFQDLDSRYNMQFLYRWSGSDDEARFNRIADRVDRLPATRACRKVLGLDVASYMRKKRYARFIREKMNEAYIVHMAGGYETSFRVDF